MKKCYEIEFKRKQLLVYPEDKVFKANYNLQFYNNETYWSINVKKKQILTYSWDLKQYAIVLESKSSDIQKGESARTKNIQQARFQEKGVYNKVQFLCVSDKLHLGNKSKYYYICTIEAVKTYKLDFW